MSLKDRIEQEADFIDYPRLDNSLEKFMDEFPDGAPARVVARALQMTEAELSVVETGIINKLRSQLKLDESD